MDHQTVHGVIVWKSKRNKNITPEEIILLETFGTDENIISFCLTNFFRTKVSSTARHQIEIEFQ